MNYRSVASITHIIIMLFTHIALGMNPDVESDNADLKKKGALFAPFLQKPQPQSHRISAAVSNVQEDPLPRNYRDTCWYRHAKIIFAATVIAMISIPTGIYFIANSSVNNSTTNSVETPHAHFAMPQLKTQHTPKHWIKNPIKFKLMKPQQFYPKKARYQKFHR